MQNLKLQTCNILHPELKEKIKGWKACLTGPFTIAAKIIVPPEMVTQRTILFSKPRAVQNPDLVMKIAKMMAMIATEYNKMGASIISMDDPTLGLLVGKRKIFYHDADFIIKAINTAIAPIKDAMSSVHICGRIAPKLKDILLKSNVNILDHEFQQSDNEGLYLQSDLEKYNKILAFGIVRSSLEYIKDGTVEHYVENEEIVKKRIAQVVEEFGKGNLILKPDCGFGGLLHSFGTEKGSEIVRRILTQINKLM